MLLNRLERAAMNSPIRGVIQRHVEAKNLLRLGGAMRGGRALELGCGRGAGAELILKEFGADTVDAFDLDPRMVTKARRRLLAHGPRARVWIGDASALSVPDSSYDAVFDFGIIHHVPDWRRVLRETQRVLKPGGRFYGEEVLRAFIDHPIARRLFAHPRRDRFDAKDFAEELEAAGLVVSAIEERWGAFAWFVAHKRLSA